MMQKLTAKYYAVSGPGRVPWRAVALSSLLFGLLHGRWVAGTAAGVGYALLLTRRGRLADAVLAHMTTNALIAAVVIVQHRWALWG